MSHRDTNKDWVRQQVQRLRAETKYTSMEEIAERQRRPPAYQTTIHHRPEFTLDEYEATMRPSKNAVPVVDVTATISRKKDSKEMEDVASMYTVKSPKSKNSLN